MDIASIGFDAHKPFCDQRAYDLWIMVSKDLRANTIVLGGDFMDMINMSVKYGKNLHVSETFQNEIESGTSELSLLKAEFPNARKVYMFGNHEFRLEAFIARKCAEFWSVLELKKLLCAEPLGFEVIPFGPNQVIKIQNHLIQHEVCGVVTTVGQRAGCDVIYGHTHKLTSVPFTTLDGKEIWAYNGGWLGDRKSPAFNYVKGWHNWQLGFTLIVDGFAINVPIRAIGNKYFCRVEGKVYTN